MHRLLHGAEAGRDLAALSTEIRLGLNLARGAAKLAAVGLLIVVYAFGASWLQSVVRSPAARRRLVARWIAFMSRVGLRLLGVTVKLQGRPPLRLGTLVVANHMSYLDVLVLSSCYPSLFVTSVEVQKSAGLGRLARLGGCLFVERRRRLGLPAEIEKLRRVMTDGTTLTIFPEGTSTDGRGVLPFRTSLLAAAAGQALQPVCLRYERVNGRAPTRELLDCVCWYGDMRFLPHLWRLVTLRSIEATTVFLPPLRPLDGESRAEMGRRAFAAVDAAYHDHHRQDRAGIAP